MAISDIKNLSAQELQTWLATVGQKSYRSEQIRQWIFKHQVLNFDEMENLPLELREQLKEQFSVKTMDLHQKQVSSDGTMKLAFRTADKKFIETVIIPKENRMSICVSTQVGCAMGCTFCRTAKMGFIRNLSLGEILEQVIQANNLLKEINRTITNVIFMGMGEPLQNFENVHQTCKVLHDQSLFNLGRKKLTISTSGVIPKILELKDRQTPCSLALSLNGTNDEVRSKLMPINKRWPLDELLAAVDYFLADTKNYITFEYILIKGITTTPQAAKELIKIAHRRRCKVNAIVLNPGDNPDLHAPNQTEIDEFLNIVRAGKVQIHLRTPRGQDILAACGQLAIKQKKVA